VRGGRRRRLYSIFAAVLYLELNNYGKDINKCTFKKY
jgi:hypothetical protein